MGNSNVLSRIEDTQKVGQRETQDHWPIFQHGFEHSPGLFGQLNIPIEVAEVKIAASGGPRSGQGPVKKKFDQKF